MSTQTLVPQFKNENTMFLYEDELKNVYASMGKDIINNELLKKLEDFCQILDQSEVLKNVYYPSIIIMMALPSRKCVSIGEWISKTNDQDLLYNKQTTIFIFSGLYVVCTTLGDLIHNKTELWWNDAYQCILVDDMYQMYNNNKQHILDELPPSFKDSTVFFTPTEMLFINSNGEYKMMGTEI